LLYDTTFCPEKEVAPVKSTKSKPVPIGQSDFDGGLLSYIGWLIAGAIVTIITIGIAFPWALCKMYGWRINHTIVNGRRLLFQGRALGLFGHWILWWILTILTLGIYGFWVFIKLEQWKVRNTTFADTVVNQLQNGM
jgi:uncharacterized membrane protein YjgN (DUF898 family)